MVRNWALIMQQTGMMNEEQLWQQQRTSLSLHRQPTRAVSFAKHRLMIGSRDEWRAAHFHIFHSQRRNTMKPFHDEWKARSSSDTTQLHPEKRKTDCNRSLVATPFGILYGLNTSRLMQGHVYKSPHFKLSVGKNKNKTRITMTKAKQKNVFMWRKKRLRMTKTIN